MNAVELAFATGTQQAAGKYILLELPGTDGAISYQVLEEIPNPCGTGTMQRVVLADATPETIAAYFSTPLYTMPEDPELAAEVHEVPEEAPYLPISESIL